MTQSNPMQASFDERVASAWVDSQWIIDEMFNGGMCLFEGYIPSIDLDLLEESLPRLTDGAIDFRYSTWSDSTTESDWNRTYPSSDYVSFFHSGRIVLLHADYVADCDGHPFTFKLMFEPEGNLEVICYRENLLPRSETHDRFKAACHHLKDLYVLFHGEALFLGPDSQDYPEWPDFVPDEWQRLL